MKSVALLSDHTGLVVTVFVSVVGLLMALLIFQQVYYTMILNRLLNKLMSRNYGEYVQSEKYLKKTDGLSVKTPDELIEENLDILDNLAPPL